MDVNDRISKEQEEAIEEFQHALAAVIASMTVMHPHILQQAFDIIKRALDEDVMPTQELKDAYSEVLRLAAFNNPGKKVDAPVLRAAQKHWRKARDKADAMMEAEMKSKRH